ncbi:MAG: hydroxypyruvate isomerase family protein [Bacillota bacterium]
MTIKLSLCIEMVFGEYPFLERIDKAAQAEVKAIEFWGWEGKELVPINEKRGNYGLELAAFTGSKTPLTDCHRTEQAVEDITRSLKAAGDLGARNVIITVGQQQQDTTLKRQKENIIKVLKKVAPKAEKRNINLVVEPLNTAVDHKGYFLSSSAEGYDIIDTVGSESVKLLFDIYHQQITEGNIIANIREHINYIGHFHLADVPGRHEPGTGELNFVNIFSAISELDYEGYVGCEFKPTGSSMEAVKNTLQMIE